MGWLVSRKEFRSWAHGVETSLLNYFRAFIGEELRVIESDLIKQYRSTKIEVLKDKEALDKVAEVLRDKFAFFRKRILARFEVLDERTKLLSEKLLQLEGKIAALEATHHKVGYVPVDAFKALSEGDIEQMAGVTEKVKDQLQQIVSLNEQLKAAGDPGVGLDGI